MSPRRVALVALVTGTVLLTSSCSESSTGNSGDSLTTEETNNLIAILISLLAIAATVDVGDDGVERSGEIDEELECLAEGGVATFLGSYTGSYDAATEESDLSVEGTVDFEECALPLSETVNAIVNGDPGIDASLEGAETETGGSYEFVFDGGVEFETDDDRSGRCDLDLTVVLAGGEELEGTFSGSACGVDADDLVLLL